MTYQFDPVHAENYGVDEAIMLHHLLFWIKKNHAEKRNVIDGNVWIYSSCKKLSEVFKFWSPGQVRRILKSLISQGVIVESHHGEKKVDQTKWYSVNKTLIPLLMPDFAPFVEIDKCNLRNQQMQLTKTTNAIDENDKCIIRNKIIKEDNSKEDKTAFQFFMSSSSQVLDTFLMNHKKLIHDFNHFCLQAEAKLEEEGQEYDLQKIYWRLRRFANNWVNNQERGQFVSKPQEKVIINNNPYRGNSF
jgi:hypothetical protein